MLRAQRIAWLIPLALCLGGAWLLPSCATDPEMISALTEMEQTPTVTAQGTEILYTENGVIRLRIHAPRTEHFQFAEEPYTQFPEGITVRSYRDSLVLESMLTANFATYHERQQLWIARHNVVAQNVRGEVLNAEQLFWDQGKGIIYSPDQVKITTPDAVIFGKGFESDETFENWEIREITGTIYVEE